MEPTTISTLVTFFVPPITRMILRIWARDTAVGQNITSYLTSKTTDVLAQRAAKRQLESIGEKIATNLLPIFDDDVKLTVGQLEIIGRLVAQSLDDSGIDSKTLAHINLDPRLLAQKCLEHNAHVKNLLNPNAYKVYSRTIQETCQYIVDIASSLPYFTEKTVAEMLEREDRIISIAEDILDGIKIIKQESEKSNPDRDAAWFEEEYMRTIVRKFDVVELFGVDVKGANRRQKLSVAYINLNMEKKEPESGGAKADSVQSTKKNVVHAVSDILPHTNKLLIKGEAGSGKTTLLQWIAIKSASQSFDTQFDCWKNTVPFLVRLRQYADCDLPTPEDFIRKTTSNIYCEMPNNWVHKQLRQGRGLVLIDGVDEITKQRRDDVRKWISDLIATFPDSKYFVTSRPYAIAEGWIDSKGFDEAELLPMDTPEIEHFIDHWHKAIEDEVQDDDEKTELPKLAENLKAQLRRARGPVRKLSTSPLLCAMICAMHRDRRRKLPQDKIELYEVGCNLLLERRDVERGLSLKEYPELKYREKKLILMDLAYWLIKNGLSDAKREDVDEKFDNKIRFMPSLAEKVKGKEVRRLFLERSGMLREPVAGTIDFTHRTFQEYLASQAILDENDVGLLVKNALDDQWREVIILASGLANLAQRDDLLKRLIEKGDKGSKSNKHNYYLLAAACLESSLELDPGIQLTLLERLRSILPPKTFTEAKLLAKAGDLAVPLLTNKLMNVRCSAACVRALCLIGSDEALDMLREYAKDDRATVKRELTKGWNYFEIEQKYPAHILSHFKTLLLDTPKTITGIDSVTQLKELNIVNAFRLKDISPICELTQLETLRLDSLLHDVDLNCLSALNQLRTLNLSLRWFHISGTEPFGAEFILEYPKRFRLFDNFTNLENLSVNPIIGALGSLENLCSLKTLSVSTWHVLSQKRFCADNIIDELKVKEQETINTLAPLTNLQKLFFSGISIMDLSPISRLPNLEYLTLRALSSQPSLEPLKNLKTLKRIEIRFMRIADIDALSEIPSLEQVILSKRIVDQLNIPYKLKSRVKIVKY